MIAEPAPGVTLEALPAGAEYTVRAIRIEGHHEGVSASAIRDAMVTKPPPWYKPWERWTKPTPFNPDVFRTDLERVRTLLRQSGYYEDHVSYDLEPGDHEIVIVLRVSTGAAAKISVVEIKTADFTLATGARKRLRTLIDLERGDIFTEEAYARSRARLERDFLERGYAYVTVQKEAIADTGNDRVQVTYTIKRGPPAVFGATTVTGLEHVAERLVRREITYAPGKPYDPQAIEKTQARIFGLELFRSVVVKPANLGARSGVVDMRINVTEGPPRRIKVGGGYGTV